jgi:uncharacterized protein
VSIIYPSTKIYINNSSLEGLGVFARVDIKEGEEIEVAPILLIPDEQISNITKSKLIDYYFAWGKGFKQAAIVWGYGSLFNHSYSPNAKYIKDEKENVVRFVAIKSISQDEEILINYNGHPDDKTKLWFEARKSLR